jgi:hypothetical protein
MIYTGPHDDVDVSDGGGIYPLRRRCVKEGAIGSIGITQIKIWFWLDHPDDAL